MSVARHLDKIGVPGSIVAALCCLGVSAFVSVVSALGLGFLLNDAVLLPVFLLFLALSLWGLAAGWRRHRNPAALTLGVAAARCSSYSPSCGSRLPGPMSAWPD